MEYDSRQYSILIITAHTFILVPSCAVYVSTVRTHMHNKNVRTQSGVCECSLCRHRQCMVSISSLANLEQLRLPLRVRFDLWRCFHLCLCALFDVRPCVGRLCFLDDLWIDTDCLVTYLSLSQRARYVCSAMDDVLALLARSLECADG